MKILLVLFYSILPLFPAWVVAYLHQHFNLDLFSSWYSFPLAMTYFIVGSWCAFSTVVLITNINDDED